MRLLPGQDERDLASTLRKVFAADHTPATLWTSLADTGVLGLALPEEYGGAGGTLADFGVFCVEAGRALCPTAVHSTALAALTIHWLGGAEDHAAWLPSLCAGNARATTSLWNASDAAVVTPTVRARQGSDGWRLSGTAGFVADAEEADHIVVSAADGDQTRVFVVDLRGPGVQIEPLQLMGEHRAFCVRFEEVSATILGDGLADQNLRRVANAAVALLSLDLVGVGEAALQRTVDYTVARRQFGRPIASFQAAQHLVANMHIALAAARLAAHSAVFWIGKGRTATRETAIARMHAATAAKLITLDAHQLHGGMGYVVETDLHLFSERARVLSTLGGGADVAATWLEEDR